MKGRCECCKKEKKSLVDAPRASSLQLVCASCYRLLMPPDPGRIPLLTYDEAWSR